MWGGPVCRGDFAAGKFQNRVDRLNRRLAHLAAEQLHDRDARRLTKRLNKHAEHLLTILDYDDVPYDNNHVERQIRPAVIVRKNSLPNRSERGAHNQAVLMSVYRTRRLRGLNPTKSIAQALRVFVTTGNLPSIRDAVIADGLSVTGAACCARSSGTTRSAKRKHAGLGPARSRSGLGWRQIDTLQVAAGETRPTGCVTSSERRGGP